MTIKMTTRLLALAFATTALVACSSNETKPSDDAQPASATSTSGEAKKATAAAAPAKPAPIEIKNPTIVSFDKMSVSLDPKNKELVGQVVERAKSSKKVVVTGFCDKGQVGNPSDVAVARAVAVRDELVRLGTPPNVVQVRFVTKVSNKHAAEIKFD